MPDRKTVSITFKVNRQKGLKSPVESKYGKLKNVSTESKE